MGKYKIQHFIKNFIQSKFKAMQELFKAWSKIIHRFQISKEIQNLVKVNNYKQINFIRGVKNNKKIMKRIQKSAQRIVKTLVAKAIKLLTNSLELRQKIYLNPQMIKKIEFKMKVKE